MSKKEKIALLLDFLHDFLNGTYSEEEAIKIANSIVSAVNSNELLETHLETAQRKTTYWVGEQA